MGKKAASLDVDPLSLPLGMRLGPWRIVSWGGRGAYGTVYRVEHVGHDEEGPFALKLAAFTKSVASPRPSHSERQLLAAGGG